MAVRADVFRSVGPFAGLGVAEDQDWGRRALEMGYRPVFVPEFIIYHPARTSIDEYIRKWDRQTAHQFEDFVRRPLGRLQWAGRALAIGVSSVLSIPRIFRSTRIPGGRRERLLAIGILMRQRLYRARRMLSLAFARDARALADRWRA